MDSRLDESEHTESTLEIVSSDDEYTESKPALKVRTTATKSPKKVDKSVSKYKSASESVPVKTHVAKTNAISKFTLGLKKAPMKSKKTIAKYKGVLGDGSLQCRRKKKCKNKKTSKGKTVVSLGISPTAEWRLNPR